MTAAAFQAQYVHWNKLKTRPEVEIVLSIPVEYADTVYQVLGGMPNPAAEVWVGVARLDPKVGRSTEVASDSLTSPPTTAGKGSDYTSEAEEPASARQARVQNPYTKKAGYLCADRRFIGFLEDRYGPSEGPVLEEWAISKVRELCGVQSRSDILPGTIAADKFDRLVWAYEAENRV